MTNKEMISAIKNNYPDSRYSMLRKALDKSILLLEQDYDNDGLLERAEYFIKNIDSIGIGFKAHEKEIPDLLSLLEEIIKLLKVKGGN